MDNVIPPSQTGREDRNAHNTVRNLGNLDGPVLVFGGPYGNLHAVRAIKRQAAKLGVAADQVICTGDVVAYCADPEPTVEELREWGVEVIRGNVDGALADAADSCRCGFEQGSACAELSRNWFSFCQAETSPESKAWMAALPTRLNFIFDGRRFSVVHGAVSDISRFVFASTCLSEKRNELGLAQVDAIIAGHTGLPFTQQFANHLWHNAGVLGLPANDGTAHVWYSILDQRPAGIRIEHRRLAYDHLSAARAMHRRGLPQGYARALETGLWPNMDILPPSERTQRSRPLAETAMHY